MKHIYITLIHIFKINPLQLLMFFSTYRNESLHVSEDRDIDAPVRLSPQKLSLFHEQSKCCNLAKTACEMVNKVRSVQ